MPPIIQSTTTTVAQQLAERTRDTFFPCTKGRETGRLFRFPFPLFAEEAPILLLFSHSEQSPPSATRNNNTHRRKPRTVGDDRIVFFPSHYTPEFLKAGLNKNSLTPWRRPADTQPHNGARKLSLNSHRTVTAAADTRSTKATERISPRIPLLFTHARTRVVLNC